jgi:putative transposase
MAKSETKGLSAELSDELLARRAPKRVLDADGLMGDLKKALTERMLNAEMDVHLASGADAGIASHRNGSSAKTVLTLEGELTLAIRRDRHGRSDAALIAKYRRRFPGFNDKIVALYARGMSTREIRAQVREFYGVEVFPDLASAVTDQVIEELNAWQARPLAASYAIVFFDALRVKIRDEGLVRNKAVYLVIGMDSSSYMHVLGLWIAQTDGAEFWLRVMNELKGRGTQGILIAVVDGLKGLLEAIAAVFPDTVVQRSASCT